jgi:SAM-dependent methyltransferase
VSTDLTPDDEPQAIEVLRAREPRSFADCLTDLSNGASLALMISVGHRSGLFDAMAKLPPATSVEIAENAGLDERYVREWLGAMATGRVVEHDPATGTFVLPVAHAARLTRAAGADNAAVGFQLIGMFGAVEDRVVECFRQGGGLPYSAFPRFQAICAEVSWAGLDATLLRDVLPLVPGLIDRLRAGIEVADVGCGCGHAVNIMAETFPASCFVGWDISVAGLNAGRAEAGRRQLANVRFEERDAAAIDEHERFDFIATFDALHDQAQPDIALRGIIRALRPGGTYLCVEIGASSTLADNLEIPWAPSMYAASCMHCVTVSLGAGGVGAGAMWGRETALRMLADAGFATVEVNRIARDVLHDYFLATKPT